MVILKQMREPETAGTTNGFTSIADGRIEFAGRRWFNVI